MTDPADLTLSPAEKEIVRWAFMSRFDEAASVHEGFIVKRWATGPNKGKPKLKAAVQGLLDRGLIKIEDVGHWPQAKFTDRGLQALKLMAKEPRALDPERHRVLIAELAQVGEHKG